jgi:hypothetical protein
MTAAGLAAIPTGRRFAVADPEAMPDDGNRHEMGFAAGIVLGEAGPVGEEPFDAEPPVLVRMVPARLPDGLRP